MANYFYFDASGKRFGPVNDQQLKALAANGTITPQTPLETDSGHRGQAGQIPDLFAAPRQQSQQGAATYFYYDARGQKFGPINEAQLKALAAQGAIHPQTVMETADGHRGQAGQIPGLFAAQQPPFGQVPHAVPTTSTVSVKTLDTYFNAYWISIAVGVPLYVLGFGSIIFGLMVDSWGGSAAPIFLVLGGLVVFVSCLVLIGGTVAMCMLLYQLWKAVPPHIARTTPGKAIGFLFIPFYNFYWLFIAYNGLGIDMNRTLQQRGIPYQVNENLGLTVCILCCVAALPYVGVLIGFAASIVMIFFLKSVKNGVVALMNQRGY